MTTDEQVVAYAEAIVHLADANRRMSEFAAEVRASNEAHGWISPD